MKGVFIGAMGAAVVSLALAAQTQPPARPKPAVSHPQPAQTSTAAPAPASTNDVAQNVLIKQNCVGCHNDKAKTGGLTLASFDAAHPEQNPDVAEKIVHKLRLGMMPPPEVRRRPEAAAVTTLVTSLELKIDAAAALHPNPGRRPFQRLNRAEYQRSLRH